MKAAHHREVVRLRLSIRELQDMIDYRINEEQGVSVYTTYIYEVQQMLYQQLRCLFLQIAGQECPIILQFDEKLFEYRLAWMLYTKGVAMRVDSFI
ncbi:MAG: hypothetical protein JKY70_01905 [Mucilaginibacter sp.]|nr:hypothetical protein [Mucilaginibacter sp.]